MREETIKGFFVGDVDPELLNAEALQAIVQHDDICSSVAITDMNNSFGITRNSVIRLCDAGMSGKLSASALNAIAFALIASDRFEWNDDIISEVIFDWSAPEINYPLTPFNLSMNKDWLLGISAPPERPALPSGHPPGKLVSRRMKVEDANHA